MEHYVTIFDSLFLPQGLALHESLVRHAGEFTLWVICMDERARDFLEAQGDESLRPISVTDVETPELLAVKPGRTRAEYCWTMTPFAPIAVFERAPEVRRVTYIDADVCLLRSPAPIFEEFDQSGKAVLITDHAYDAEYDSSALSGQYCVQFMTFVRGVSEPVRSWWQNRCIEWCFNRLEGGKLGDQKYLDDWPVRFGTLVHVLGQLDAILAPWNARRFPYSRAIAWHFHGLRLLRGGRVLLHRAYSVPRIVDEVIYLPYVMTLKANADRLGFEVVQSRPASRVFTWPKAFAGRAYRILRQMMEYEVIRRIPSVSSSMKAQGKR